MADKIVSQFNILHNSLDESLSFNENRYNQTEPGAGDATPPAKFAANIEFMSGGKVSKTHNFRCIRCSQMLPADSFAMIDSINRKKQSYFILDRQCLICRKDTSVELTRHPLLTPAAQKTLRRLTSSSRHGSFARGLVCGITEQDTFALWIVQKGKCALTGVPMICHATPMKDWNAPSIDRIDSDDNYVIGNVHLVCWAINMMKSSMSVREFRRWCAAVVKKEIKDLAAAAA